MNSRIVCQRDVGKQVASKDWSSERAYKLLDGELYSNYPLIDSSGFYLSSSSSGHEYIESYNATIRELTSKYGLPSWAPGSRRIDPQDLSSLYDQSLNGTSIKMDVKEKRNLIRRILSVLENRNGVAPVSHLHIPNKKIIILFSKVEAGIRADVIDLHYSTWMQSDLCGHT